MSSLIEEVVNDLKWGLLSGATQESLARAMSEALVARLTARKLDVSSGITVDVSVLSTPKLTPLHSQLEVELPLKVVFSTQHLLPAENAQSLSSMPGSGELSITTPTVTPEDYDC